MTFRSLDKVDRDLCRVEEEIAKLQERKKTAVKTRKKLLRQERDKVRYIIGGLIVEHMKEVNGKFPDLVLDLYNWASKRDQIKFVKSGFVDDNLVKLVHLNKQECQQSVESFEPVNELSSEEKVHLDKILKAYADPSKKLTQSIYGRAGECFVYIDHNVEFYITDQLAAYLRDNKGFSA
jgi:hypothetical protein